MRWFQWWPEPERWPGREARNEQRKLRAQFVQAVGLAFFISGFAAPFFKAALAADLNAVERMGLCLIGLFAHLAAARIVRDIEDKS